MPNKKEYPNWFSINRKPGAPIKPKEWFDKSTLILNEEWGQYHSMSAELLLEKLKNVSLINFEAKANYDYDGSINIMVTGFSKDKVKNPQYEELLIKYEENYVEYKKKLKKWTELSEKWKQEEAQEKEAAERKQLELLKKKYG